MFKISPPTMLNNTIGIPGYPVTLKLWGPRKATPRPRLIMFLRKFCCFCGEK